MPDDDKQDKPKILIDSDWKAEAEREKEELAGKPGQEEQSGETIPPPDFLQHCGSLATHAMILLGAIPNPMTGETQYDPQYARHLIDTIVMLRDKAKGNLTDEEDKTLEHLVGELRMAWVSVAGKGGTGGK